MAGEPRLMDDSIEAIRQRHEASVVWAEGEVTPRVSDALWRAKKDVGLLLDDRDRLAEALRNLLDDTEPKDHNCGYPDCPVAVARALLASTAPAAGEGTE